MSLSIAQTLNLGSARIVNLIGGGGKTSLMFALAAELVAKGERVITTTTTKILAPAPETAPVILFGSDPIQARRLLRKQLLTVGHVTIALESIPHPEFSDAEKLKGIDPGLVDELAREGIVDRILVEADGAARRSLKAHADHEPVISSSADLVIVLIGVDCIGARLNDKWVHRAGLFAQRIGGPIGRSIRARDVAAIVHHREGYLSRIPAGARVVVVLNKVSEERESEAVDCAQEIYRGDSTDRIEGIVLASFVGEPPWMRVCPRCPR